MFICYTYVHTHYRQANPPVPVSYSFLPLASSALLWQLAPPLVLFFLALASPPPAAAAELQGDAPPPSPLVSMGHVVVVALPPDVDAPPLPVAFAVVDVPPPPAIADDAVGLSDAPLYPAADADVAVLPDVDVLLSLFADVGVAVLLLADVGVAVLLLADVDVAVLLLVDVCDAALVPPSGPVDAHVAQPPGNRKDTCNNYFCLAILVLLSVTRFQQDVKNQQAHVLATEKQHYTTIRYVLIQVATNVVQS